MLFRPSTCGVPSIILLCWIGVNDAGPFGQHPAGEVRPTASSQSKTWDSTRKTTAITGLPRSGMGTPKPASDSLLKSTYTKRRNYSFNYSMDVNDIHAGLLTPAENNSNFHEKQATKNNRNGDSESDSREEYNSGNSSDPDGSVPVLKKRILADKKKESPKKCPNEARRRSQIYTRSMPLNTSSIDPTESFKLAGETEAKKTSSVNIGEDIALCWIETTTIKEDPAFDPPKRLVVREFTISVENSATIRDDYLECNELEGEIAPGDEETVSTTSLREVIDENTKLSRVINFTSVSHVGPTVVRQHRTVRCSIGAVVTKDIYEWPDGTDNPKKRVEIKVGPSIRELGTGSHEEPEDCPTDSLPERPKADESISSSSDCSSSGSCETSAACEDGQDCSRPSADSACEGDDCSTRSSLEETKYPTAYRPDSDDPVSPGVTRRPATKESEEDSALKSASTPLPHKPGRANDDSCEEGDLDCVSEKSTGEPETGIEGMEVGRNPERITPGASGESCREGSEDCSCSGSSCSVHSSEESSTVETGNERTDVTTVASSMKGPNETFTESTTESSKDRPVPLNDSECDSPSGECSTSLKSSSEEVAGTKTDTAPGRNTSDVGEPAGNNEEATTLKNTDDEATTQQAGETEHAETIGATDQPGLIEVSSNLESVLPCNSSGSQNCATAVPGNKHSSREELRERDESSPTAEGEELPVTKTEDSETSRPRYNDDASSSSCDESSDDGSCKSTGSSSDDDSVGESDIGVTGSTTNESEEAANSSTSEEPEGVTNSHDDGVNSASTARSDEGTSIVETTVGSPESTRNSSLPEEESTECSPGSESGDCGAVTTASSMAESKTILSSNQEDSTLSPVEISSSAETNRLASTNATATAKRPEGSTCDENSESCESPSSGTDSETCEEGSSSGDCTGKGDDSTSESCDSASGSCSSESGNPAAAVVGKMTTTTEATSKEFEHSSTTIDNVSTTVETRRSTVPTLSLTSPSKGHHRLALRIKVLLERINENKEKEQLVQVEKHLLINEKPNEHGNKSLIWQIKSLNDTMNVETLKAIFNCSGFERIAKGVGNLTEFGPDEEGSESEYEKTVDPSLEKSMDENEDESSDKSMTDESIESSERKKREVPILEEAIAKRKNITEAAKATAIRDSLPGVEEDFKKGMDHVLSRVSKELDAPATSGVGKVAESSPSNILKILASPSDGRVHSRRRRGAKKVGEVMFVEQLKNPVKGEEIDRWSNERLVSAADGGKVRSVMEFKLLRDTVEDSRRVPLAS